MDYNKIKIFQVVSEYGSVTLAAKKLQRTQSAVSQQIKTLEEELGFKLFKRRRGSIFLSPQGKRLSTALRTIFGEIDDLVLSVKEDLKEIGGKLRLGALSDFSTQFDLAQALLAFTKKCPKVELTVCYGSNQQIESWLVNGDIDIGISIVFEDRQTFVRNSLCSETHVLACGTSIVQKVRQAGIHNLLSEFRIIDFSHDFLCMKPWIKKNAPELLPGLKKARPSIIVPSHIETLKFVKSGWGLAILPQYIIRAHANSLSPIWKRSKNLIVQLDAAYLANRSLKRSETILLETLKNVGENHQIS